MASGWGAGLWGMSTWEGPGAPTSTGPGTPSSGTGVNGVSCIGANLLLYSIQALAYLPVDGVVDVKFQLKAASVDVTTLNGTRWNRKYPTLNDGGNVPFTLLYDPLNPVHNASGGYGLCWGLMTKSIQNFKLTIPSNPVQTILFAAFVSQFPLALAVADVIRVPVTLTITGQPIFS